MNEIEQAIDELKQQLHNSEDCVVNGVTCELAIEALEKQIPKKPIDIEDKMWTCPICYNNLMHKWIKYKSELANKKDGLQFCLNCGQKLDWSVEE